MTNKTIDDLHKNLKKSLSEGSVTGKITVNLGGIESIISGKDAVGHLMQEWFFDWCKQNEFKVIPNPSTQRFPDYFIDHVNNPKGMLEIKNFDVKKTPAFDVADFYAFIETLPNDIEKLYADYIVFGYDLKNNGDLSIPNIWKMKVWELVGKSRENNVTCQIRKKTCRDNSNKCLQNGNVDLKGRLQKLRPYNFKVEDSSNKFNNALEFLIALQVLLDHNHNTKDEYSNWLKNVKEAHVEKFGKEID